MRYQLGPEELLAIGIVTVSVVIGSTIGFCQHSSNQIDIAKEKTRQEEVRSRSELVGMMVLEKKPQGEINAVMDRWNAASDKSKRREELVKYFVSAKPNAHPVEIDRLVEQSMKE